MKLISNWRAAWRLWSVRLSALGTLLSALALASPDVVLQVWQQLPADLVARLPVNVTMAVPMVLFIASGAARLVKQRSLTDDQ